MGLRILRHKSITRACSRPNARVWNDMVSHSEHVMAIKYKSLKAKCARPTINQDQFALASSFHAPLARYKMSAMCRRHKAAGKQTCHAQVCATTAVHGEGSTLPVAASHAAALGDVEQNLPDLQKVKKWQSCHHNVVALSNFRLRQDARVMKSP